MNRAGFMDRLESLLADIPETERKEALQYYNDYFEFEAGLEYLLSKESLFRREVS